MPPDFKFTLDHASPTDAHREEYRRLNRLAWQMRQRIQSPTPEELAQINELERQARATYEIWQHLLQATGRIP